MRTPRAILIAWMVAAASVAGCDRKQERTAAAAPAPAPAPEPLRLDAAAVIGASVSAGAEVSLPGMPPKMFGGDATLADVLAAITDGPAPTNHADVMFFSHHTQAAEKQLAAVKSENARLVFAVDYLFWHAYGGPRTDEGRRELFQRGLDRLGSLDCTVVIADIPDMSHAVGSMLFKQQVPSAELLSELNAKLADWAANRKNVVMVRLRDTVADAMAKRPTTLGGHRFDGPASRGLLVQNGLHTSADGQVCLALECLAKLQAAGAIPPNRVWETDIDTVKRRLIAAIESKKQPAGAGSPGK